MGPHINRRTLVNIREAGLLPVEERNVFSDWIKVMVVQQAWARAGASWENSQAPERT